MNNNLNFLIVEDEFIASTYLKNILLDLSYETIFIVKNSKDACELIKEEKIDLVFMDINIEGSIDGIECAKKLNEISFTPVIFTSAYHDKETIKEALKENIYGYLIKPFDLVNVQLTLKIALKNIKEQKEKQKQESDFIEIDKELFFDKKNMGLYKEGNLVNLTKRELLILKLLCMKLNKNVSYVEFKNFVWNEEEISISTIRDAISKLKKKGSIQNIQNIQAFGYILKNN